MGEIKVKDNKKKFNYRKYTKGLVLVLIGGVIFFLGRGVGNGSISLSKSVNNAELPSKLDYTTVNQVYQSLKDNYDGKLTEQQLLDGLKHGLAQSTNDPYTVYFTPKEATNFNNQLNNEFSGIGAELGQDSQGTLQVISPITGMPADKAGLKAQDLITSINGQTTQGMSVDSAVKLIRGKAGTSVTLTLVRGGQPLTITITRQNITLPSVNTKTLDGNIGYMQITTFADDTSQLSQAAANKFASQKVKGMILDLRNDPGGLLTAATSVSNLWLGNGKLILQEKTGNTVVASYQAEGDGVLNNIPTVILINGGSASASEITTGALHDNNAAYVIGEKSYGKGVVQQLINFNDGSQLKVTVASWYRPNGQNINKKGITPDKVVTISSDDTSNNVDTQLNAAIEHLNSK